jgi:hypothetical protein
MAIVGHDLEHGSRCRRRGSCCETGSFLVLRTHQDATRFPQASRGRGEDAPPQIATKVVLHPLGDSPVPGIGVLRLGERGLKGVLDLWRQGLSDLRLLSTSGIRQGASSRMSEPPQQRTVFSGRASWS